MVTENARNTQRLYFPLATMRHPSCSDPVRILRRPVRPPTGGPTLSAWLVASGQVIAMRRPPKLALLVAVLIALVSAATIAFTFSGPTPAAPSSSASSAGSSAPVVNVSLTDSGGPMGEGTGPMHPGAMGLKADRASVPAGIVTFRVNNVGAVIHEMVILPLTASQPAGIRPFGSEAKIDEKGSLGEASKSGGQGAGEGIEPGAVGRISVTLAPGQYELVCNLMGHYVSGMYSKLTVT